MSHFNKYMRVLESLEKQNVDYIVVGALPSVILFGMERLTRDVRIFVKMAPESIKELRKAPHTLLTDCFLQKGICLRAFRIAVA